MGDGDKFSICMLFRLIEKMAVTRDLRIIQSGVDFVEQAERGRV